MLLRNGDKRFTVVVVTITAWSWRAFLSEVMEVHFWTRASWDGGIKDGWLLLPMALDAVHGVHKIGRAHV